MSSEAGDKGIELSITASAGAAAGSGLLAVGAVGAATGAGLAVLPVIGGAVFKHWQERGQRRASRWVESLIAQHGSDAAEILRLLEERAANPDVQGVIFEHVQKLQDAVDDCVVPALGALAAPYIRDGLQPDYFFRGLTRVLCDLSEEEFRSLQRMAAGLVDLRLSLTYLEVRVTGRPGDFVVSAHGTEVLADGSTLDRDAVVERVLYARRLFALLKTNGLASEVGSGFAASMSGPGVMAVEYPMIGRISNVIGRDPQHPGAGGPPP